MRLEMRSNRKKENESKEEDQGDRKKETMLTKSMWTLGCVATVINLLLPESLDFRDLSCHLRTRVLMEAANNVM